MLLLMLLPSGFNFNLLSSSTLLTTRGPLRLRDRAEVGLELADVVVVVVVVVEDDVVVVVVVDVVVVVVVCLPVSDPPPPNPTNGDDNDEDDSGWGLIKGSSCC